MSIQKIKLSSVCFLILFIHCIAKAQPNWDTRKIIDSIVLFQDWKEPSLWYYAPGDLKLKTKENGSPDFQLVSLRSTGTNLYGNKGELRYRNILQFTIMMQPISILSLNVVKKKLQQSAAKLIPIPIQNIETYILTSAGSGENSNKRLGKATTSGSTAAANGIFWSERSFALALDNFEAQLIDDQLKNNRLALSCSYSFGAQLIPGKIGDFTISGDSSLIEKIGIKKEDIPTIDTILTDMIIKSNAFGITIDLNQYPDIVKKVDINESYTPPAYAFLDIHCYDFKENIRPDILFKAIEIEATSVNGEPVRTTVKFSKKQPDINSQVVQFEYAVKMNKPLRYRVIETDKSALKTMSNWKTLNEWRPMIDISSNTDDLGIEERTLDFELLSETLQKSSIIEASIALRYTFLGKNRTEIINIQKENEQEGIFKSISIRNDKKIPIQYQFSYKKTDKSVQKAYWRTVTNDYVQLKLNQ